MPLDVGSLLTSNPIPMSAAVAGLLPKVRAEFLEGF